MATCPHCGVNPAKTASKALRNAFAEMRQYRLHRAFGLNEHPRTHHGAIRIELVRLDADRRGIRKIRRRTLRQVARYWRECSQLRKQYPRLRFWMNEVHAELDRRRRVRRRRAAARLTATGRH